jgi:hypothetical protein
MKITTTTATATAAPVYKFLNLIIVASVVLTLLLNGGVLTKQQRLEGGGGDNNDADLSLLQPQRKLKASNNNNNNNNNNNKKKIRPKILVGIFVDDTFQGCSYRKRHRSLFGVWNDTRVCSLVEYETENDSTTTGSGSGSGRSIHEQCELIYTFVTGVNKDPNGPTEIVDNSTHKLLAERSVKAYKQDCLIFCGFEHDL